MGDDFEVWGYEKDEDNPEEEFKFKLKYYGNEMQDALEKMFELKKQGIRCIKLVWRQ